MADATTFNLKDNQKAQRKLLVTCVDVSDNAGTFDASTAEWQIIGVGVEDSSIEYNPDTNTVTDILGITETTVNKLETEQDLDPMTIRGGSKLAMKLYNQVKYGRLSELSMYNVMQIHAYIGSDGAYDAEVHKNCTITPQSLGGDYYVDMPININFSNDKIHGTANNYKYGSTIKFTAATSAGAR